MMPKPSGKRWLLDFLMKEGGPPAPALIGWLTLFFGLVGVAFSTGFIWISGKAAWTPFCFVVLVCLGASVAGFFVGFLFGIPKVLQGNAPDVQGEKARPYEQRVNTNLEQISDWLTKILVGVGLVQLNQAPAFLWKVSTRLSQAYSTTGGPNPTAVPAICSAIVYFSVLGTLSGYLITRLYFAAVFAQADQRQVLARGSASGSVEPSEVLPEAISNPVAEVPVSDHAKIILATLARYQKELFGLKDGRRWTFTLSPAVSEYPGFLKGVSELLDHRLVAINPTNGHVMLSNNGLGYVSNFSSTLGETTYGPFGSDPN